MTEKNREMQFEEAMEKLEQIVNRLENEEVPLEEAIELFQEGMRLSKWCGGKLDQVEKKIDMLIEEEGQWVKREFDPPQEESGDDI